MHAHLNSAVREPVADFCRRNGMLPHLIADDVGFDRGFELAQSDVTLPVTLDWIVTTHLDHFELLLVPGEASPWFSVVHEAARPERCSRRRSSSVAGGRVFTPAASPIR